MINLPIQINKILMTDEESGPLVDEEIAEAATKCESSPDWEEKIYAPEINNYFVNNHQTSKSFYPIYQRFATDRRCPWFRKFDV